MRAAGVAIVVTVGMLGAACGGGDGGATSAARDEKARSAPSEPTTAPASTGTTAPAPAAAAPAPAPAPAPEPAPPPPPAPPAVGTVPPEGLGPGATGPQVLVLEQRLTDLRYDVGGPPDDRFERSTEYSVVAFQKVAGLPRTGRATQDVADALTTATPPTALVPAGGPNRVEIDLPRQVLLLWQNDALAKVLPISSANNQRFCDGGRCRVARTPAGSFRVGYRIAGWHESDLGELYNPVYYQVGPGIAIHGSEEVPPQPASHGCVRIPMFAAETFPGLVPDGTPVYVIDGTTPIAPIAAGGPPT